jgi:hypothetical protein
VPVGELASVLAVAGVGTAVATTLDALAAPLDGMPATYFLIALALPFWDRLPTRTDRRITAIAGAWIITAALWYLIAMAGGPAWWCGAGAFGLSCLIVGWTTVLITHRP